jgi:uncharacterized membrane-anchored protein
MTAGERAEVEKIRAILATLHPVHGTATIPEAEAQFNLGKSFYFLNAADAKKVVTDVWGNPPEQAEGVLGMVLPEGGNPASTWGAVITYEKSGYVSDKDASATDYGKYVKQIQDGEADNNAQRQKAGYATTHLVGWAQPPSYDPASHTMIWARDLQFGSAKVDTLNYDVRLLGRHGVLSMNMVDTMPDLADIRVQAKQLAAAGSFVTGARYQDYQAGKDNKAAYGLAGLVAAGVGVVIAKKVGLIGLILLFGKKAIVLVVAAGAAIARWFGSIFGRKKKKAAQTPAPDVSPSEDLQPLPPTADSPSISQSSES